MEKSINIYSALFYALPSTSAVSNTISTKLCHVATKAEMFSVCPDRNESWSDPKAAAETLFLFLPYWRHPQRLYKHPALYMKLRYLSIHKFMIYVTRRKQSLIAEGWRVSTALLLVCFLSRRPRRVEENYVTIGVQRVKEKNIVEVKREKNRDKVLRWLPA